MFDKVEGNHSVSTNASMVYSKHVLEADSQSMANQQGSSGNVCICKKGNVLKHILEPKKAAIKYICRAIYKKVPTFSFLDEKYFTIHVQYYCCVYFAIHG